MQRIIWVMPIASLVFLQACSSGPTSKTVKNQLDISSKGTWDFEDVEILESRSEEPLTAVKFKATGVNSEPTFLPEKPSVSSFFLQPKKDSLEYVRLLHDKGSKVSMSGSMALKRDPETDKWTSNTFFTVPLAKHGVPKSQLQPRQVLRGSKEEEQFQSQQSEEQRLDREATLKRFLSQESKGYMSGDFRGSIQLRFDEVDDLAKTFKGQATYSRGVIKGFSGKYSDRDLVFTTDREIQGKDDVGVGTKFSLLIESLQPSTRQIRGTYGHQDRRSGKVIVTLGS